MGISGMKRAVLPLLSGAILMTALQAAGQEKKVVPVTFWDFNSDHPEFEGAGCFGPAQGNKGMVTGLDADRKPTQTGATTCPDAKVNSWFRPGPDNARYCRDLELTRKAGTANTYQLENHLFFPIDGVPSQEPGSRLGDDGMVHNFNFCMEMHATFKYRGDEVFDLEGDDDIWFFVNGKLVVDMGGVHRALNSQVSLSAIAGQVGITVGNYYPIDFFFCERQAPGSELLLNTSIDIIPAEPPGHRISDAAKNPYQASDTIFMDQGAAARQFHALEIKNVNAIVDCANLGTQSKEFVDADWFLDAKALPMGKLATIDGNIGAGIHRLILVKGTDRDTLMIRIRPFNTLAKPVANPPGSPISRSMAITLSHPIAGAVIHYTLDGTDPTAASPVYAGPLTLTAATILKAIAIKTGWINSAIMSEEYGKTLARALSGYYLDRDGDGRIETAVVRFNGDYQTPPASIRFTDPFRKEHIVPGAAPQAAGNTLTYALDPAFDPGTGFAPDSFALILPDPGAYAGHSVAMADSAGPVARQAVSFPVGNSLANPSLEVTFSEELSFDGSRPFPFEIKRAGSPVAPGEVILESAVSLGGGRYRFVFIPGSKYPIPGDSIRIAETASIRDRNGVLSIGRDFIPVGGTPASVADKIDVSMSTSLIQGRPMILPSRPVPVIVHSGTVCLNCNAPGIQEIAGDIGQPNFSRTLPTLTVAARFPFSYSIALFDHVGQFINRLDGDITDPEFSGLRSSSDVNAQVPVNLSLLPVSRDGRRLGSGAYILSVVIRSRQKGGSATGPQGETLTLIPASQSRKLKFGYVRR